jgi:UDP-N-acetylmuramyl pentapeptide synthase
MVIGITGRQVKTTTKQMMASILISRFHTLKFPENCNDYRSIPLNIGITNVGEAHVGNLGNRLQNVVRAKQELSTACPGKLLVLNTDAPGKSQAFPRTLQGKGDHLWHQPESGLPGQPDSVSPGRDELHGEREYLSHSFAGANTMCTMH